MFGAIAFVEIILGGKNAPPRAHDDIRTIAEHERVPIDVLYNDPEGDKLTLLDLYDEGLRGKAEIVGDRIFYDPGDAFDYLAVGASKTEILTYFVTDEHDAKTSAQLKITIEGEDDPVRPILPSSYVVKLQKVLIRDGFWPGAVDGIMGPQTLRALFKWAQMPRSKSKNDDDNGRRPPELVPPWSIELPSEPSSTSPPGADSLCWLPGLMQFFVTKWDPIIQRRNAGWLAPGYTADNCFTTEETAEEEDELWRVGLENDRFVDQGGPPVETSTVTVSPPHDQAGRHHERRGPGMHTRGHERKRHHGKGSRGKKKRH